MCTETTNQATKQGPGGKLKPGEMPCQTTWHKRNHHSEETEKNKTARRKKAPQCSNNHHIQVPPTDRKRVLYLVSSVTEAVPRPHTKIAVKA